MYPDVRLKVLLTILCAVALHYIFLSGYEKEILAYCTYALSAYTLIVIVIRIPRIASKIKR